MRVVPRLELEKYEGSSNGRRLDLSEIRPKLDVVEREAGTDKDLPRSPRCLAISSHFSDHWSDYVERVPEIARLEMIYRAYVGARFLVHNNPGLVARIQQLPTPALITEKPLRIVQPDVIRVCYENGRPVPIKYGTSFYYIGKGYCGGTEFKMRDKAKITIEKSPEPTDSWARAALASSASGTGFVERGEEAAISLEVAVDAGPLFDIVDNEDRSRRFYWSWRAIWLAGEAV